MPKEWQTAIPTGHQLFSSLLVSTLMESLITKHGATHRSLACSFIFLQTPVRISHSPSAKSHASITVQRKVMRQPSRPLSDTCIARPTKELSFVPLAISQLTATWTPTLPVYTVVITIMNPQSPSHELNTSFLLADAPHPMEVQASNRNVLINP